MTKRDAFFISIMLLVLVTLASASYVAVLPLENTDTVRVVIQQGDTLSKKSRQWQQEGWLPSALLLRLQAKVSGYESLRVGEFDIPPGLDGFKLLFILAHGKPVQHKVTLIEGKRLADALDVLASNEMLQQDIQPLTTTKVAVLLGVDSAEGWIYPDTYVFGRDTPVSTILKQAHQRMQDELQQAWETRAENLPYTQPYDALVMASIVEKETAVVSERPTIAGVFVRRLQKNMRLETDPTVIYGLGETFDGDLRRSHLRDRDNLHNTYRHKGLPPTPIALAGREALDAALNPADGEALYFVARGDGSHQFSATLAEHQQAVREYQLNRRSDYRSSPVPATNPQTGAGTQ